MTKSNKTVAADTTTVPAITLPSIVDLNLKVHSEQVIKKAVSEFEEACITKKDATKQQLDVAVKAQVEAAKKLANLMADQAKSHLIAKAEAFASAYSAFSGTTNTKVDYDARPVYGDSGKVASLKVVAVLAVRDKNDRTQFTVEGANETIPANDAVKAADEALNDCATEVKDLTNLIKNLAVALADLPRMQRRAEAALATKVLMDVEGGPELMESLKGAVFTGEITKLLGA